MEGFMKLRVATIGCGGISRRHLAGYKNMRDIVEIVAFCDLIEERAKNNATSYETPNAPIYVDYKKLIEDKDKLAIDAIDICTPNNYHSIIAVDALKAGINVFFAPFLIRERYLFHSFLTQIELK